MFNVFTKQRLQDEGVPAVLDTGSYFTRMSVFLDGKPNQIINWQFPVADMQAGPTLAERQLLASVVLNVVAGLVGEVRFVEGLYFGTGTPADKVVLINDEVVPQIDMQLSVSGLTISGFPVPSIMIVSLPSEHLYFEDVEVTEPEVTLDLSLPGLYHVGFVPVTDIIYNYTEVQIDYQTPSP